MSKKPTILVTGIGGTVGQGIIRNIHHDQLPLRIIGTNTERISNGNHLPDRVYEVPFGNDPKYLNKITHICRKENVRLIIPSTDYEAYSLSLHKDELPPVAASAPEFNYLCLDKYRTWENCRKAKIPFAETCLPSKYRGQFADIIVKPREGRGSRGVVVNPGNCKDFSDDYVVQKLYKGDEITVAFYVTRKHKILSYIVMARELYSGFTSKCCVTDKYNKAIGGIISQIVESFPVAGSCNIQAIAESKTSVIPFEFNARISGTNSIRAHFGFPDVRWTIEEYLFNKNLKAEKIKPGAAMKVLMDVIYPGITLNEVKDKSTRHSVV